MSGWIVAILLALVTLAALGALGKLPRPTWEAAAAAVILALAGYAYQGSPAVPSAPSAVPKSKGENAKMLIEIRSEMDRSFSNARPYLILSDAYARDGDYQMAAAYINSGIRRNPDNADLWAGLGLQLLLAGDGQMSPPAKFAFDRARSLSPIQPAPDYFAGLTALFEGRSDEALGLWRGLIERAPKDAKWKARLESQVKALAQMQSDIPGSAN
jgi:cytochrome c-type biogenesis protein CcmH/NrfG